MNNLIEYEEYSGQNWTPDWVDLVSLVVFDENLFLDVWSNYFDSIELEPKTGISKIRDFIVGDMEEPEEWEDEEDPEGPMTSVLDNIIDTEGAQVHDGAYMEDEEDDGIGIDDEDFDDFYKHYIALPNGDRIYDSEDVVAVIDAIGIRTPNFFREVLENSGGSYAQCLINRLAKGSVFDYEKVIEKFSLINSNLVEELNMAGFDWKKAKGLTRRARILERE